MSQDGKVKKKTARINLDILWRKIKMAKDQRFEKVYSQGMVDIMEIWVDRETGVNYVFRQSGYAGGMTPLLDREGKPVISPIGGR